MTDNVCPVITPDPRRDGPGIRSNPSDPQNPRFIGGGSSNIGGGFGGIKADKVVVGGWDAYVPSGWPKPAPIPNSGGDHDSRTSEDISDPWLINDEYDI